MSPQVGFMISIGYLGQLFGALLFSWLAHRFGRVESDGLVRAVIFSHERRLRVRLGLPVASQFRTLQGFGCGGEVPIAAVYISEITRAKGRGRFVLLYELVFPVGLVGAALLGSWVVPNLGWRHLFWLARPLQFLLYLCSDCCLNRRAGWRCVGATMKPRLQCRTLNERPKSRPASHCPRRTQLTPRVNNQLLVRPFRCAVSPTHAGRLANVVCGLSHYLWIDRLVAYNLSHGFPFAACPITTIWPAHTSHRSAWNSDVRTNN